MLSRSRRYSGCPSRSCCAPQLLPAGGSPSTAYVTVVRLVAADHARETLTEMQPERSAPAEDAPHAALLEVSTPPAGPLSVGGMSVLAVQLEIVLQTETLMLGAGEAGAEGEGDGACSSERCRDAAVGGIFGMTSV